MMKIKVKSSNAPRNETGVRTIKIPVKQADDERQCGKEGKTTSFLVKKTEAEKVGGKGTRTTNVKSVDADEWHRKNGR